MLCRAVLNMSWGYGSARRVDDDIVNIKFEPKVRRPRSWFDFPGKSIIVLIHDSMARHNLCSV